MKLRRKISVQPLARVLAFVLCSCASVGVDAVYLSPQGPGQALVYPYYTVNGSQDTLFTLVNLGSEAKAVKVRFLEGYNSRDVLDLNVYLAAGDVWAATVTADGEGARLIAADPTCTVPDVATMPDHAIAFTTQQFDGNGALAGDGGPTGASRVREGHVEVIEMGVVTGASAVAASPLPVGEEDGDLDGGAPVDCARLREAWSNGGYWVLDPYVDLEPPTGGLTGNAAIVNVGHGTVQGYVADALGAFHSPGTGRVHTGPESLDPNLASGTSLTASTWPSNRAFTATFSRAIDAVTAVFMSWSIYNDFWTASALGARSEWVITYPTKRFYTDPHYVGDQADAPFADVFGPPGQACAATFAFAEHDYNAARRTNVRVLGMPFLASSPRLCFATQVATFRQGEATDPLDHMPDAPSDVLASMLVAANFPSTFENGWAAFSFGVGADWLTAIDGSTFIGQPVTGFLAAQFVNGSVDGALANYTIALRHRTSAYCRRDTGQGGVELCE
jgi:hypothetical protein